MLFVLLLHDIPDIYSLLPRYPSAPVWYMGSAARGAGTGIAGWDMPDIFIPYSANIDTTSFLLAFTRRTRFLPYAYSVNRARFL